MLKLAFLFSLLFAFRRQVDLARKRVSAHTLFLLGSLNSCMAGFIAIERAHRRYKPDDINILFQANALGKVDEITLALPLQPRVPARHDGGE